MKDYLVEGEQEGSERFTQQQLPSASLSDCASAL